MKDNEKAGFVNGLNVMCDCFQVPKLNPAVIEQYWVALKDLSTDQFKEICRDLMKSYNKKWSTDFPLPAAFLEAIKPDYQREVVSHDRERNEPGFSKASEILPRLIALLPPPGKFNNDEEAAMMVAKMNSIVEEVFKDTPPRKTQCEQCDDCGYVYCWFQFTKRIEYIGTSNEVLVDRTPNSPYWITKCNERSPHPDLNLTACIARCTCSTGLKGPKIVPLMDSFKPNAI